MFRSLKMTLSNLHVASGLLPRGLVIVAMIVGCAAVASAEMRAKRYARLALAKVRRAATRL